MLHNQGNPWQSKSNGWGGPTSLPNQQQSNDRSRTNSPAPKVPNNSVAQASRQNTNVAAAASSAPAGNNVNINNSNNNNNSRAVTVNSVNSNSVGSPAARHPGFDMFRTPEYTSRVIKGKEAHTSYQEIASIGKNNRPLTHDQLKTALSKCCIGQPVSFEVRPSGTNETPVRWHGILSQFIYYRDNGNLAYVAITFDSSKSQCVKDFVENNDIPCDDSNPFILLHIPVPGVDYLRFQSYIVVDAFFEGLENKNHINDLLVPYSKGDINALEFAAIRPNNTVILPRRGSAGNSIRSNNDDDDANPPPNRALRSYQSAAPVVLPGNDVTTVRNTANRNQMLVASQQQPQHFQQYAVGNNNNNSDNDNNEEEGQLENDDADNNVFCAHDPHTWHYYFASNDFLQSYGPLTLNVIFQQFPDGKSFDDHVQHQKEKTLFNLAKAPLRGRGGFARGRGGPSMNGDEAATKVDEASLTNTLHYTVLITFINFLNDTQGRYNSQFAHSASEALNGLRCRIQGVALSEFRKQTARIHDPNDIAGRVITNIAAVKEKQQQARTNNNQRQRQNIMRRPILNNFNGNPPPFNNSNAYNNRGPYVPQYQQQQQQYLNYQGGAQASTGQRS